MALGTLASRLVRLEQTVAQHHNTSLNPQASLQGLDPQWVADEIAHCRADAVYFVDTYCKVESDTGAGVVPFKLFEYQIDVLEQWLEHDECIVLKARQLGITELAAALALWTVNFHQHNKVILFSQDEPKAKEFARKCRIAWEHLPAWLQPPLADPQKTTTLELANGSRILPQAATERAARSLNCQLLILDEWAHQENGRAIFAALAVTARSPAQRRHGVRPRGDPGRDAAEGGVRPLGSWRRCRRRGGTGRPRHVRPLTSRALGRAGRPADGHGRRTARRHRAGGCAKSGWSMTTSSRLQSA
jgi:hypothetical protein